MRKITKQSVAAFFAGVNFSSGNTRVSVMPSGNTVMYLHGNAIAALDFGVLSISDCGWQTPTTKERLNGVLQHVNAGGINQHKFEWFLNGESFPSNEFVRII